MALKLTFVLLAAFLLLQFAQSSIVRDHLRSARDAPAPSEKPSELEEALNKLKQGFDEFASKVQESELFQNTSKILGDLGDQIKEKGSELVNKIKTETATKTK